MWLEVATVSNTQQMTLPALAEHHICTLFKDTAAKFMVPILAQRNMTNPLLQGGPHPWCLADTMLHKLGSSLAGCVCLAAAIAVSGSAAERSGPAPPCKGLPCQPAAARCREHQRSAIHCRPSRRLMLGTRLVRLSGAAVGRGPISSTSDAWQSRKSPAPRA